MTPGPRRIPIQIGVVLYLILHAVVLASDMDGGRSGAMGTVLSVDREKRVLTVEESSQAVNAFRLDEAATLIFRDMFPLRVEQLRPGMRVEIDYRRSERDGLPVVTWIEVLEERRK